MKKMDFCGKTRLRRGFTTGSCAAAAAKAAATMLFSQRECEAVKITTPKGETILFEVLQILIDSAFVSCAVKKFSGDDPDITSGAIICAKVRRSENSGESIQIIGGKGVGRVTKPGLEQAVGEFAINKTPRKMITDECVSVCRKYGHSAGLLVEISVEGGEELAKKTFNPRLGIEGGLSILGTSGIVEPMSQTAIVETIRAELSVIRASGAKVAVIAVGNYAERFARENLGIIETTLIKCGNFIGDTVKMAVEAGFERVLLVGHIGKLVKLGIGITNTHSGFGDGRIETLTACAIEAGCDVALARELLDCATADAAVDLLKCADRAGLLEDAMYALAVKIDGTLRRLVDENTSCIGFVCFRKTDEGYEECLRSRTASAIVEEIINGRKDC